uniref:Putative secreted protein n=1 Tax=Ixodes ricinus TaxID=34613 RepID=A0A6B0UEZ6_IXORI
MIAWLDGRPWAPGLWSWATCSTASALVSCRDEQTVQRKQRTSSTRLAACLASWPAEHCTGATLGQAAGFRSSLRGGSDLQAASMLGSPTPGRVNATRLLW